MTIPSSCSRLCQEHDRLTLTPENAGINPSYALSWNTISFASGAVVQQMASIRIDSRAWERQEWRRQRPLIRHRFDCPVCGCLRRHCCHSRSPSKVRSYIHSPRVGAERPESGQSIGGLNSFFGVGSGQAGNITDDVINHYLNEHAAKDRFSPSA